MNQQNSIRYDYIEEVQKFNPYHDARGRFATADGFASFTVRTRDPGKQHMADAAIARERERAANADDGMTITATGKTTLPDSVLNKCREVEAKTVGRKTEKMTLVDENGRVILEKSGGKRSVSFGAREGFHMNDRTTLTHNHPGEYGGTFSGADVKVLVDYKLKGIRAVGKEGTYSLERGDTNSNKAYDFNRAFSTMSDSTNSKMRVMYNEQKTKVARGEISVDNANMELSNYRTTLCNEQHNWLVQNAAQYGFNYVFEPAGGVVKMHDEVEQDREEAEEHTGEIVLDGEFLNGDDWMIRIDEIDDGE